MLSERRGFSKLTADVKLPFPVGCCRLFHAVQHQALSCSGIHEGSSPEPMQRDRGSRRTAITWAPRRAGCFLSRRLIRARSHVKLKARKKKISQSLIFLWSCGSSDHLHQSKRRKKKKKTNQTRLPTKKYSPNKQNKTKNPTRHPNSPQKGIERERSLVK